MNSIKNTSIKSFPILKVNQHQISNLEDELTVEEPLEIQIAYWNNQELVHQPVSVTMRTPSNDALLALGFLFTEGIITSIHQVSKIAYLPAFKSEHKENRLVIGLHKGVDINLKKLERHFYTNSSCGVCGKASIEALDIQHDSNLISNQPVFSSDTVFSLPHILRAAQTIFQQTGSIHAAGLFDKNGQLLYLQEDVGRHNAMDKLIGQCLQQDLIPLQQHAVVLSGRLSFELVQKAIMADIPIVIAVGAPSSLAVELAMSKGMTLIGFLRNEQFNLYCGSERIHTNH